MIQRYLLRQARAALPRLHHIFRPSSSASSLFSSPQIPITSSFLRPIGPRCYSTTPAEADVSASTEAPASDHTNPDAIEEEQDPSKKELEAKTREIIDLKVRLPTSPIPLRHMQRRIESSTVNAHPERAQEKVTVTNTLASFFDRINTFAPSRIFETSKNVRNVTSNPPATLPSLALPWTSWKASIILIVPSRPYPPSSCPQARKWTAAAAVMRPRH